MIRQFLSAIFNLQSGRRYFAQGLNVSQEAMLDLIFAWFLKQGLNRPQLIEPLDDRAIFRCDRQLIEVFEQFVASGKLFRRNTVGNHGPDAQFGYQEAGRFSWTFQFIIHVEQDGTLRLEMDIDRYRPLDVAGGLAHAIEVLWHKLTRNKTKPLIAMAHRRDLFPERMAA